MDASPPRRATGAAARELAHRRARIVHVLLGSMVALGMLAYVPSVWLAVRVGAWGVAAVDTAAYLATVAAFLARGLSYRVRAGALLAVAYVLGVVLTAVFGPVSAGPIWLCAVPVLAAVLLDLRQTLWALALTAAALVGVGGFEAAGWGDRGAASPGPALLAVIGGNLLLVAAGLALAVNTLIRGLHRSAERAERLAGELAEERRRLEELNAQLRREMEERAEAEARLRQAEKLTAMGTLAGGVAHNLNNLLTPLLMGVTMLRRGGVSDEVREELLARMYEAASAARDIVRQVLAFSRALPSTQTLDAFVVFEEALRLLRASLPETIRLETHLDRDAGYVSLSPADAHQIVLNLGSNAVHAMPDGGVLTVSLARTTGGEAGLEPGAEYVRLTVRDTGVGMDERTLQRAVEPFFTTREHGGGTGLGLASVHGVVAAAGGRLRLESTPGEGTTAFVYLPRLRDPVTGGPPPPRPAPEEEAPAGSHVLVVDDDVAVRAVTTTFLLRMGHEVTEAAGTREALAWLRGNPGVADLLLTDFNMPDGGGVELIREARALEPGLMVLVMSGYLSGEIAEQLAEVGVGQVLSKPFRMDELAAAVAELLAAR